MRPSAISRRQFVVGAGASSAALLAGCGRLPWEAAPRPRRIGYLSADSPGPDPFLDAFVASLHMLGYVEGDTYRLEIVFAEGQMARLPEVAAQLVQRHPDVILTGGTVQSLTAQHATTTIPIVFANPSDPVGSGLVASLAHPGGNVTGLSTSNRELTAKRLELGFVCEANPYFGQHRAELVSLLAASQRPVVYAQREFVLEGGLMSYAADYTENYRRAAVYVDKILRGTKPADLPVEQPMIFDFVVNMKTAGELGITFPNEIMLQVTEVIQ